MARQHIYTVYSEQEPSSWKVVKMDREWEYVGEYHVNFVPSPAGGFLVCGCFASNKETCRHRQMVKTFIDAKAVNSRRAYDFDRQRWIEPPRAAMDVM